MENFNKWASKLSKSGCSSISFQTKDNLIFWGRNFDFHEWIEGTKGLFIPKNRIFYTMGNTVENNIDTNTKVKSKHAIAGVGTLITKSTPVLYDGINDCGLMGGMLYFVNEARYANEANPGTLPLQAIYVVTYMLSQCSTIDEIQNALKNKITIVNKTVVGQNFQLHWIFTDKNNESAILECTNNDIKLHRNTMGILTNSPNYSWQKKNLYQYKNINNTPNKPFYINGEQINPYCTGTSEHGMPGDWSAPSRFVRAAILKQFAIKATGEYQGVIYLFKMLQNLQYIKGLVYPIDGKTEYTIYMTAGCSQTLNYYVSSYESNKIICLQLDKLKDENQIKTFNLPKEPYFEIYK